MPHFQPLGEELLSATAPTRDGRAASKRQQDWVSQGRVCRALGTGHCVGEAHSLCPELGFAELEAGEGTREVRVGREGVGRDQRSTKRSGRGKDAKLLPGASGCDWSPPAVQGGGRQDSELG